MTGPAFLSFAIDASQILVILSIMLAFGRLAMGPSLADRIVALDMMTVSITAFCALFAVSREDVVFLDIVIVLALVGFLATVAMSRFSETFLNRLNRQESSK
jgi:multisubunit Na+/H+ antiporter MnhF subunit